MNLLHTQRSPVGWRLSAVILCLAALAPSATIAQPVVPYSGYCAGDANWSGQRNLDDVVYLVNFVFKNGPAPEPYYLQGDATCDARVNTRDIISLVSYWFRAGQLCEFCGQVFADSALHQEAQVMAMWYSQALEPPDELSDRFMRDLNRIRTELTQLEPALDGLFFHLPWGGWVSDISLYVDSQMAHQVRDSSYHAWDSLNVVFEISSITERLWFEGAVYVLGLHFSGLKNPELIIPHYQTLPGVQFASVHGEAGSPENHVLPRVFGDSTAYLLMQGWGDCPSGCLNKRYFYVKGTSDSLHYVGRWSDIYLGHEPEPDWWPEACQHLCLVYPWTCCD